MIYVVLMVLQQSQHCYFAYFKRYVDPRTVFQLRVENELHDAPYVEFTAPHVLICALWRRRCRG